MRLRVRTVKPITKVYPDAGVLTFGFQWDSKMTELSDSRETLAHGLFRTASKPWAPPAKSPTNAIPLRSPQNFRSARSPGCGRFEKRYSRYLPDSLISRINHAAGTGQSIPIEEEDDRLFKKYVTPSTSSPMVCSIRPPFPSPRFGTSRPRTRRFPKTPIYLKLWGKSVGNGLYEKTLVSRCPKREWDWTLVDSERNMPWIKWWNWPVNLELSTCWSISRGPATLGSPPDSPHWRCGIGRPQPTWLRKVRGSGQRPCRSHLGQLSTLFRSGWQKIRTLA